MKPCRLLARASPAMTLLFRSPVSLSPKILKLLYRNCHVSFPVGQCAS
jgi:hypothetical protein